MLSHIYLVAGCLWPPLYSRRGGRPPLLGVVLLCAGDAAAAAAGRRWGRRRLPNGKSLEGAAAFAAACLGAFALAGAGAAAAPLAAVGALVELFGTAMDSLTLPVLTLLLATAP